MADPDNWRVRRTGDTAPSGGGGGIHWGSGAARASSSKAGGHGKSKRRGGGGGGGGGGGKADAKVLPTHAHPLLMEVNVRLQYAELLDRAKKAWIENPKNVVVAYTQHRFGTAPKYECQEGYISGRRDTIVRCTLTLDPELGIEVVGDGKKNKEAEKAAALHGMLVLLGHNYITNPPPPSANRAPGAAAPGDAKKKGESVTLTSGTTIDFERAREFIDYFCQSGHYGKPEVVVSPAQKRGRRSSVQTGWLAEVAIGGAKLGQAEASSKKAAQHAALLDTAAALERHDQQLWRQFDTTHKPGAPVGKAPHVVFSVSEELDEHMRDLYDMTRRSELYAKRPVRDALYGEEAAPPPERRAARRSRVLSEEEHAAKSARMLEELRSYQTADSVRKVREQRYALPVMQRAGDVLVKVELNQVTVCMAATGSGKTTQVPQILLDDYILGNRGSKCNIVCTQPRRIAAISVAQRVAAERGESLGKTIGYQVRFDHRPPQPNGSITFCTTGVFLRRLQSALSETNEGKTDGEGDAFLDGVTHVVMDEVHERDVETDLMLVVIKRLLAQRKALGKPEIKLVLMSATVDPTLFQNYFAELSPSGRPAPVVDIPGRSFPVERHFLEETYQHLRDLALPAREGGWVWQERSVRDYIEREITQRGGLIRMDEASRGKDVVDDLELPYPLIALMIADVLARSDDGHVLVFMPGWDEMKAVHQILLDTRQRPLLNLPLDDTDKYEVHVLHSSVPVREQQAVFEPPRHPGIRRIILATNIAETSITIPDVVYVIDTGRVKEKRYDPERHLSSLVSAWVGTSNLNQRAGRAGRHRAGEYYGVLSKARYDQLNVHQTVEMKRVDLTNVVMHIKALDIPGMEVEDVLAAAIEPPAAERVHAAMIDLERVGALDFHRNLTSLGRLLQQLPLDVSIGKMCLYGALFRCLDPVLSLASVLTNRDPFMAPVQLKREADMVKDSWSPVVFRSDPLSVLNVFYEWTRLQSQQGSSAANRFLSNNFLSRPTMLQIQQVKQNLFQTLEKAGIIDVVRTPPEPGTVPRYRVRVRETDPEFNVNSGSTPLLCALIAVASSPNFAIRATEKAYRTSQDKTCFIHPSSVCHAKFAKNAPEKQAPTGDKELFAFAEKVRNTSRQTANSGGGGAMTFLRSCTRLDPLTYMLFGASEARVSRDGLECDDWLPVTGNYDALDSVERLKAMMDSCMLRVFEGIGKRRPPQKARNKGERREDDHQRDSAGQEKKADDTAAKDGAKQAPTVDGARTAASEAAAGLADPNTTLNWSSDTEDEVFPTPTPGSQNQNNEDEDEDVEEPSDVDKSDRSISPREAREFEMLTTGIVQLLDAYATERSWRASTSAS